MRWSKMEGGRLFRTLGTATEAKSEQLLDSLLHCNWLIPNIVPHLPVHSHVFLTVRSKYQDLLLLKVSFSISNCMRRSQVLDFITCEVNGHKGSMTTS